MNRKFFRRFHSFLGLTLMIPALWFVVTGVVLGYFTVLKSYYISSSSNLNLDADHTLGVQESLHQLNHVILSSPLLKKKKLEVVYFPKFRGDFFRLKFSDQSVVIVSQKFFKIIDSSTENLFFDIERTLYQLHRGKFFGFWSQILFSLIGFGFCLIFLMGLFFLRSRQKSSLHAKVSFFFGLFIFYISLTGALSNFSSILAKKFDPVDLKSEKGAPFSLDLLSYSTRLIDLRNLESIHLAKEDQHPHLFYFKDSSRLYLDSSTGQFKRLLWHSHWSRSILALHGGRWLESLFSFNLWVKPLYSLFFGSIFVMIFLSGFFIHQRKKL